jgi:hypothetical protein
MRELIGAILLLFSVSTFAVGSDGQSKISAELKAHWRPSLSAVLANPTEYVEQNLTLFGYLHLVPGHGLTALFLTRDHALNADYSSSIAIGLPKSDISQNCAGQYVTVSGIFEKMPGVSGTVGQMYVFFKPERISYIYSGGKRNQCWPKHKFVR